MHSVYTLSCSRCVKRNVNLFDKDWGTKISLDSQAWSGAARLQEIDIVKQGPPSKLNETCAIFRPLYQGLILDSSYKKTFSLWPVSRKSGSYVVGKKTTEIVVDLQLSQVSQSCTKTISATSGSAFICKVLRESTSTILMCSSTMWHLQCVSHKCNRLAAGGGEHIAS